MLCVSHETMHITETQWCTVSELHIMVSDNESGLSVTVKTFELLPNRGWIWLDFADLKHDYIKEVYWSDMCFAGHGPQTGQFQSDWLITYLLPSNYLNQCLIYCQLDPSGQIFLKFESKYKFSENSFESVISKNYFVQASMCEISVPCRGNENHDVFCICSLYSGAIKRNYQHLMHRAMGHQGGHSVKQAAPSNKLNKENQNRWGRLSLEYWRD